MTGAAEGLILRKLDLAEAVVVRLPARGASACGPAQAGGKREGRATAVERDAHAHGDGSHGDHHEPGTDHEEIDSGDPGDPGEVRDAAHKRGIEDGYAAGFEEGHAAGIEAGRAAAAEAAAQAEAAREAALADLIGQAETEVSEYCERIEDLIAGLEAAVAERLARMAADCEADLIDLCYTAICRLAGEQAVDRDGVRQLLIASLRDLAPDAVRCIRVAPADLEWLRSDARLCRLLDSATGGIDATWVADPQVGRGGWILEGASGSLDARLETRLLRLGEALAEAHAREREPEVTP